MQSAKLSVVSLTLVVAFVVYQEASAKELNQLDLGDRSIITEYGDSELILKDLPSSHIRIRRAKGKGSLKTKGSRPVASQSDCTCTGMEAAGRGSGPRTFALTCRKNGKSKVCNYKGNPHTCSSYNKDQATFYNQLRDGITPTACRDPYDRCPDTKRGYFANMCGDTHGKNSNSNFYNTL